MKQPTIIFLGLFFSFMNIVFSMELKKANPPLWPLLPILEYDRDTNSVFFADPTSIITCHGDITRITNIYTGEETASFSHKEYVLAACLGPENLIAISIQHQSAESKRQAEETYPFDNYLFDGLTGKEIHSESSNRIISPNHFDSKKELLATLTPDSTCDILNIKKNRTIVSFDSEAIHDMCFHPRKKILAMTTLKHDLEVYDIAESENCLFLESFENPLHSMCFNHTGELLAVASDNQIDIINLKNPQLKNIITSLKGNPISLCFDPTGMFLAALFDKKLHIFEIKTTFKEVFSADHNCTSGAGIQCFDPSGKLLVVGCNRKVNIYSLLKSVNQK
jgi:hypothetical protein